MIKMKVVFSCLCPGLSFIAVFLLLLIIIPSLNAQDYTKFQTYDQMTKSLQDFVNSNKNIAKLESIGKTTEGRDLWLVTIANSKGTPVAERPGLLIGANFEGDHLFGSQLAISVIDHLTKNYNSDEKVKKSIDENVYYILPRVNPDGAEFMFANIKTGRKTNTKPYDSDNDGRMDEDGPEDLNKDGEITVMRVKDSSGLYMIDSDDARLMKKADPAKGETGLYKLYWEGIDNDGDGFINEDPPGGIDINRNFQHEYPYYEDDSGWHMISENESRAVMDWIISHRNVAMVLTFGESDNLIKAPNSKGELSSDRGIDLFNFADASNDEVGRIGMFTTTQRGFGRFRGFRGMRPSQQQPPSGRSRRPARKPETTVNKTDLEYFTTISKKYIEITGIKVQPALRTPKGAFFQYAYYQYGVPSFSTPGWGITAAEADSSRRRVSSDSARPSTTGGGRGGARAAMMAMRGGQTSARGAGGAGGASQSSAGIDKELIEWMDKENVKGFVEWKTFNHATLGEVEIGGFSPYEVTNPPAAQIIEMGTKHGEFAVYLSSLYAKIKIAKTELKT